MAIAWEQEAEWLGFLPSRNDFLRQTTSDPDFEPGLLLFARRHGQLTGCVMGVRRPWKRSKEDLGFIKWVFVADAWRRQGIGRRLLTSCESAFRERAVRVLVYGSSAPQYLYPGVPESRTSLQRFLDACGWKRASERVSLYADLDSEPEFGANCEALLGAHPAAFQLASEGEANEVARFVRDHFTDSWAREVEPAWKRDHPAFCCVARDPGSRELVGFAAMNATNPAWFGPMGVKKTWRGKRVGSCLVRHALSTYQRGGGRRVVFPWINENLPFYQRIVPSGLARRFVKYERNLIEE